jgi:hypothetical protein
MHLDRLGQKRQVSAPPFAPLSIVEQSFFPVNLTS